MNDDKWTSLIYIVAIIAIAAVFITQAIVR